jgi:GGDEF domain-containing protein
VAPRNGGCYGAAMDTLVAAFWGAFFGTVALMLAGSLVAFARSLQRVALMSGLSAVISAGFVVAYLGLLPMPSKQAEARLLSHVAIAAAVTLGLMLLSLLGYLKQRASARRAYALLLGVGGAVVVAGWMLDANGALALGSTVAFTVGAFMLLVAVRSAIRGDRLAWAAVSGVTFMLISVGGLSWVALNPPGRWQVHAASAIAGMAYLSVMAAALWSRYSYLLELSHVMALGPSYDPVTRMRSHSETGLLVGDVFLRRQHDHRPVGVIAVTLANLYALENLHGRAAFNHALYVCASRLRRAVPANVEMGRLGEDGFLVLLRNAEDTQRLVHVARQIRERLSKPIELGTSADPGMLDARRTVWIAEAGVGVLATSTRMRPSQAVATARAMSRTAWSYASRLAWFDQSVGQIAELPVADPA